MSERLDRIFEALPIFPLSVVLFPGEILPLHVFEERYKLLVRHALDNSGLFGLSYRPDAAVDRSTPPRSGSIGCAAKINAVMPLDDGRMNLVTTGLIRYRVVGVSRELPFVLARVESITDEIEPEDEFKTLVEEVNESSHKFFEIARALDELGPLPNEMPDDAESLSLLVASALPIDAESKQNLLEITSTRSRLSRLRHHLLAAISSYDEKLKTRERARKNGHGKLRTESLGE